MTEKTYHLKTNKEKIHEFMDSVPNNSKTLEELLLDKIDGNLIYSNEANLDLELKKVRIEKLKVEIDIKKKELSYMETFDKTPTSQAKKAIEKRVLTQNELGNVQQYITLRTNGTGFTGICDFCKLDITEKTRDRTLSELSRHLIACHSKEILKE